MSSPTTMTRTVTRSRSSPAKTGGARDGHDHRPRDRPHLRSGGLCSTAPTRSSTRSLIGTAGTGNDRPRHGLPGHHRPRRRRAGGAVPRSDGRQLHDEGPAELERHRRRVGVAELQAAGEHGRRLVQDGQAREVDVDLGRSHADHRPPLPLPRPRDRQGRQRQPLRVRTDRSRPSATRRRAARSSTSASWKKTTHLEGARRERPLRHLAIASRPPSRSPATTSAGSPRATRRAARPRSSSTACSSRRSTSTRRPRPTASSSSSATSPTLGAHTLQIRPVGDGRVDIDGFVVLR